MRTTRLLLATTIVISLASFTAGSASAQIASWVLNGVIDSSNPHPPSGTVAGVSAGDLTASTALGTTIFANAFAATNWPVGGLDTSKYLEFAVTADPGHTVDFHDVTFSLYNNFTGTSQWQIRSSEDGHASALDSGTAVNIVSSGESITADVSSIGPVEGTVIFRLYTHGNTGSSDPSQRGLRGSGGSGDDLHVNGVVAVIPVPVTVHVPSQFPTISAAVAATVAGDTIEVAPGTYVFGQFEEANLVEKTLRGGGANPADVVITRAGGSSGPTIIRLQLGTMENLTIENVTTGSPNFNGDSPVHASASTIRDCVFQNCVGGDAGALETVLTCRMENCLFSNNVGYLSGAVYGVNNSQAGLITGCTFVGNDGIGGGAIRSPSALQVTNCTMVGNVASYATIFGNQNMTIRNCILHLNVVTDVSGVQISFSPVVTYSNVQGGYPGVGNIDVDPLLSTALSGHRLLTPGSPCRDAGDPADAPGSSELAEFDHEGDWRLSEGRVDMGADEFIGEYPGSSTELRLRSGAPGSEDEAPLKPAQAGDVLFVSWESVLGNYDWTTTYLVAGLFPTGGTLPSVPGFPELYFDANNAIVINSSPNQGFVALLLPGGSVFATPIPPVLGGSGLSMMLQSLVVAPNPSNPFFTASNGTVIEFQ